MLMVRLVLDLLARRASGGPVPILASVASWNPAEQDLRDWLGAQLMIDHPALTSPPPADLDEPTQAAALLASGLILPVLDGLDEVPEHVRGPAISRINDALRPGEQVVLTCRTEQYREAVRPQGGAEVTLRAAAAVQLCPLDANAVRGYLCDDAAGPVARARWAPVLAMLGTEAPAGQALDTPLMVGLARSIYNPRPGELAGTLRDPAELCRSALADRTAVESLLFDEFIPSAYRHDRSSRWRAEDAQSWLVFLARYLERKIASQDLAWWQLREAVSRVISELAFALIVGLSVALLMGLVFGLLWGALAGLTLGVVFGTAFGSGSWVLLNQRIAEAPSRGMRIGVNGLVRGIGIGCGAGLAVALGAGTEAGVRAGVAAAVKAALLLGLGFGTAGGCVGVLVTALAVVPGDLAAAVSPLAVLVRDRQAALVLFLGAALGAGAGVGFALSFVAGVGSALGFGLSVGLGAGLFVSVRQTMWPSYMLTRAWLAFRHQLPWSLMTFLADAHRRGVLRQAGAVYQFRHIELQHRLANRP